MEFGKIDILKLNEIDLRLPVDDPRTWIALKLAKARNTHLRDPLLQQPLPLRIGVGAPVWGVKDWVGKVYPVGTQSRDYLYHYSRQFNSIELNGTHYGIPDSDTIVRWRDSTPSGFKFNPKMLQDITHRRGLCSDPSQFRAYMASVMGLEDRLGFVFVQLPPTFGPDQLQELRSFLRMFPKGVNVAIEARHSAFFSAHRLVPKYYDLLSEMDASVVITDVAGRRDVLHTSLPNARVMVRFIGNDLHPTDHERIADWVARIKTWMHLGLEQIEFFVHEPEDRCAPDLISTLIDKLNRECGVSLTNWSPALQGTQLTLL